MRPGTSQRHPEQHLSLGDACGSVILRTDTLYKCTQTHPSFSHSSSELDEIRASAIASKPEQSRVPLPSETTPAVEVEEEDEDSGELYDIPENVIAGTTYIYLSCRCPSTHTV